MHSLLHQVPDAVSLLPWSCCISFVLFQSIFHILHPQHKYFFFIFILRFQNNRSSLFTFYILRLAIVRGLLFIGEHREYLYTVFMFILLYCWILKPLSKGYDQTQNSNRQYVFSNILPFMSLCILFIPFDALPLLYLFKLPPLSNHLLCNIKTKRPECRGS